jgi:hypothetical protein
MVQWIAMLARTFWQLVVRDRADFLPRLLRALSDSRARYCVIGGVAVNAYVEPQITLDFDVAIAAGDLQAVEDTLAGSFDIERFPHTANVTSPESDLRVQITTDPRYAGFFERAEWRTVLGFEMRVASIEDVLQGKLWAAESEGRRLSKRQKDLFDIARLLEAHPELRTRVPEETLAKLPF